MPFTANLTLFSQVTKGICINFLLSLFRGTIIKMNQKLRPGDSCSHCFSNLVLLKSDASTYGNVLAGNARKAGVRPLVFCREAEHMAAQHDIDSCA